MLRLVQTADLRLAGRHQELGERGAALRERRSAALAAIVDLALAEQAGLVLVVGNLFDSNAVSRRTVEIVARQLGRLAAAGIACAILPGTRDGDALDSLLRVHDLAALSGVPEAAGLLVTLSAERPAAAFASINVVVGGLVPPVRDQRGGHRGRLFDAAAAAMTDAARAAGLTDPYRVGLAAAWPAGTGAPEGERVLADDEIAASGFDLLALGGPTDPGRGSAGATTWISSGAPEVVSLDRDDACAVQLVAIDGPAGRATIGSDPRRIGTLRIARYAVDVAQVRSQEELLAGFRDVVSPDQVLLIRLEGMLPDGLEVDPPAVEAALADRSFAVRVVDASVPVVPSESPHPAGSLADLLWQDLAEQVRTAEARGDQAEAIETRRAFRLVRELFDAQPAAPTPAPTPASAAGEVAR